MKGLVPTPNERLRTTARESVAGCGRSGAGFTLIEVLVVMAITVVMTGLLIANFSRTRVDLNQTTLAIRDAVREAQSMALAGSIWRNEPRCGYGIHFESSYYVIYAGPVSGAASCVPANYGYKADQIVRQGLISNSVLEIASTVADIFFEPPDPKTYFDGNNAKAKTGIAVRRKGTSACPSADCRIINVTTSGQIQ